VETFLVGGRMLLAVVFGVSAVAKLADRTGTRQSLLDFHVPPPLVPLLVILLPLLEIASAAALVTSRFALSGAAGALTLLLSFIGAMAYSLSQGRRPDCHCFGQLHSKPVGHLAIFRNVALAVVAAFILVGGAEDPGPSAVAWIARLNAFQLAVIGVGTAGLALLTWNLVLMSRLLRVQLASAARGQQAITPGPATLSAAGKLVVPETAGLPVGSPAPEFALPTLRGDKVTLKHLRRLGKPIVLFFSDAGCGPCVAMLPEIGRWQRDLEDAVTLVVVSRGNHAENMAKAREAGIGWLLLQRDRETANAYQVFGSPSAVRIEPDGTIGTLLAQGEGEIRVLMARSGGGNAPSAAPVATGTAPAQQSGTLGGGFKAPASLPPGARPVKHDCVEDQLMSDGTIVLYNGCRNNVLTLNGTAALVWEYCDGEHDARAIAAVLRDVFPDAETAEHDVTQLLDSLVQAAMIGPAKPSAVPVAASPERF
jgi:peroxiredoxin